MHLPKTIRKLFILLIAVSLILLIPFTAMQFTDEVKWTVFDFIIAAIMLLISGLLLRWASANIQSKKIRIIILILIIIMTIILWIEMAVGIFETPISGH